MQISYFLRFFNISKIPTPDKAAVAIPVNNPIEVKTPVFVPFVTPGFLFVGFE